MSGLGLVSRATLVHTAMRNCSRNEGGPSSSAIRCDIFQLNPKTAPLDHGESFALQQLDAADVSDGYRVTLPPAKTAGLRFRTPPPNLTSLRRTATGHVLA
jgi:hypothetical protein